jgi:hypothetical protein
MSTRRQKPIDFAAEGLCLASLSIPTAESGFNWQMKASLTRGAFVHREAEAIPLRMIVRFFVQAKNLGDG